jgi:hypothetical protein
MSHLHGLLDGLADVAETDVDAGHADAGVGGVSHRLHQLVVLGVEVEREGAVDDAAAEGGVQDEADQMWDRDPCQDKSQERGDRSGSGGDRL